MASSSQQPDLAALIKKEIKQFTRTTTQANVGSILELGDGIAIISGLSDLAFGELVAFDHDIMGLALNLRKDSVGVVIMGDYTKLSAGDQAKSTGRILDIGVGEDIVGRVVDPLGQPLDGKSAIKADKRMLLDKIAPGIIARQPVNEPMQTGIKAIDSMIPIGRGQRELIIGDRGTGKSSVAMTTILNQHDQDMICVYVAIGQKESFVAQLTATLQEHDAMKYSVIVDASASMPPALQYLAPLAGCAIGEYFAEKGKHALVVYDDLSKHAWAYRELSLLLRRPTGREAYPGDIFYLHSSLLERATKYSQEHGSGSLTALPIIETQLGDVSAYIPTNVISITDGQIYLEADLFNANQKPAINVGSSVSRVGSSAQSKIMKQVAKTLKLDLAQYRDLAAFAQFASDLDDATKKQIERGKRAMEVLKQDWDNPYNLAQQAIVFWTVGNGYVDDIPLEKVQAFETGLLDYIQANQKDLVRSMLKKQQLDDKMEDSLKQAVEAFKKGFILD